MADKGSGSAGSTRKRTSGSKPTTPSRTDGRSARWGDHRAARREELIAAVVAAVRDLGPGVGMDDIAAHSGIAKPVFYRYFVDKADLHLAVGRRVADAVVRRVTAALDGEVSARAKLAAAIDCYLRMVEADPDVYAFVVHGEAPRRSRTTDPVEDYATVVGLSATTAIGEVLRAAGADAGAAEPWGFGLVGMVRSAADRWLAHRSMPRPALVAYLTDLVVPGLVGAVTEAPGGAADWTLRSVPPPPSLDRSRHPC